MIDFYFSPCIIYGFPCLHGSTVQLSKYNTQTYFILFSGWYFIYIGSERVQAVIVTYQFFLTNPTNFYIYLIIFRLKEIKITEI